MTTIPPRYGATALHMAAAAGHLSTVKAVLQAGGYDHHDHHHQCHHHSLQFPTIPSPSSHISPQHHHMLMTGLLFIFHYYQSMYHHNILCLLLITGLVEEDTMSRLSSCPSPTMIGALHGRDVVLRFVSS